MSNSDGKSPIHLRATSFDHPRNFLPLQKSAEAYQQEETGVEIAWDTRSLKDFEDCPVDRLAEIYDLVIIDHPSLGAAVESGALLPLEGYLTPEFLADQKKNSVGPSYRSYTWEGQQWALAVDAAAQVSGYRKDLLTKTELEVPRTWGQVFELVDNLSKGVRIGLSLNPTHAFCSFLSLYAGLCDAAGRDSLESLDPEIAEEALGLLQRLAEAAHEACLWLDPIGFIEHMAHGEEIAYAPLVFGYSNYARPGFAPNLVRFADVPAFREEPAGAVLGGAGLAISAYSKHPQQAANYAAYVAGESCQKGLYFGSGGQPGHRVAWEDPAVNEQSNNFFTDTLRTLDLAHLRPRHTGVPALQKSAGKIIHRFLLQDGGGRRQAAEALGRLYEGTRPD